MDSNLAAIIAIAASISVPMIILMLQSRQSGRSSFATEARWLYEAQAARAERAEHDLEVARSGPPSVQGDINQLRADLHDHKASDEYVHNAINADLAELGREFDTLRRQVRDLFNKRGDTAGGTA